MAGKPWKVSIHKVDKQWVVDTPGGKVIRGKDTVEWELIAAKTDAVTAQFQFVGELFTNLDGRDDLTKDWTAKISGPGKTLKLLVSRNAGRAGDGEMGYPRHYAVWVNDPSLPGGGAFAVGPDRNPPPEVIVGP